MKLLNVALSSLLLGCAFAFEDTSPFILAVSHKYVLVLGKTDHRTPLHDPLGDVHSPITISAEHFHTLSRQTVSQCSSQVYVLVSQPGLHVTDFTANTVPYLRKVVKNAETKVTADYGYGGVDLEDISLLAQEKCKAEPTAIDARRKT
jgi:hypothetical protein